MGKQKTKKKMKVEMETANWEKDQSEEAPLNPIISHPHGSLAFTFSRLSPDDKAWKHKVVQNWCTHCVNSERERGEAESGKHNEWS